MNAATKAIDDYMQRDLFKYYESQLSGVEADLLEGMPINVVTANLAEVIEMYAREELDDGPLASVLEHVDWHQMAAKWVERSQATMDEMP